MAERPESLRAGLIAPCGMNCGICIGHMRAKKSCPGCHGNDGNKPWHCVNCAIKNCSELQGRKRQFCFVCGQYPCLRLRRLDKRYRTRYGMSMSENLENIRALGIREFVARENIRWRCPHCGGRRCVHRPDCMHCGRAVISKSRKPGKI